MDWKNDYRIANLEEKLEDGSVRCHLSPRKCKIKEGEVGFCGVRGNRDGRLVTYTFGKGVHITEEAIETEAIFHYAPGSRILSLGNIGCNLNCHYCQNWKTSQYKFVENKDVHEMTPQGIVDMALRHNIGTLSWTYNDPVVWHEFVIETAKLARKAGLTNLYKSACFITKEALDELLPHIDIFSLSLKSMDETYYRKLTTGWLQPVLEAAKQIYEAGKHLEISNLMITDISDNEESALRIAKWILKDLGPEVPLHLVRFHPEYRMQNTIRTPIDRLQKARTVAQKEGLKYVYLGNVPDENDASSFCGNCQEPLVKRFGLDAKIKALDSEGRCNACGENSHFNLENKLALKPDTINTLTPDGLKTSSYNWRGDIISVHVQAKNTGDTPATIYYRPQNNDQTNWKTVTLEAQESYRFILTKSQPSEIGLEIAWASSIQSNLFEVFDRAHFPTVPIDEGIAEDDRVALPKFEGKQFPDRIKSKLAKALS
jgi:pyruvate formate lyase activating enzyme